MALLLKNYITDVAEAMDGEVWHAVTTAIPSRLAKYIIPKKELAFMHVTMIDRLHRYNLKNINQSFLLLRKRR